MKASGVHQDGCLGMSGDGSIHAAQQAHAVGMLCSFRHEVTDPQATLAMLTKLKRASK